jgi:DNA-binding CsgD family transcriptional regulator
MAGDIVDRIYEAAAIPDLWEPLLDEIAQMIGAEGALLFVARATSSQIVTSPKLKQLVPTYFERGYQFVDERTRRLFERNEAGFLSDLDVFTPEEWRNDPIRKDFWEPAGMGWGIATQIGLPDGENIIIHSERLAATGPFERAETTAMNALRPHLARATLMSARLAFEKTKAAMTTLEMVGLPAAALDRRGVLYHANNLFNRMVPEIFIDLPAGMQLAEASANAAVVAAIGAAVSGRYSAPYSVPLPARGGHPPMIVHLLPVAGVAQDVFSRSGGIMIVTPVTMGEVSSAQLIQGLFDLTPAEARVARAIGNGETIAAIAAGHQVAEPTVRNQLREIFAKTGVHRQAELVGLLRGIPPMPGG